MASNAKVGSEEAAARALSATERLALLDPLATAARAVRGVLRAHVSMAATVAAVVAAITAAEAEAPGAGASTSLQAAAVEAAPRS